MIYINDKDYSRLLLHRNVLRGFVFKIFILIYVVFPIQIMEIQYKLEILFYICGLNEYHHFHHIFI